MRVNSHVLDAYGQRSVDRAAETKSEGTNPAGRPTAGSSQSSTQAATLSISSEAKRLAAAHSPVDAEKVAAIRQRIQSGEFEVDSAKIAEKMLDRLA